MGLQVRPDSLKVLSYRAFSLLLSLVFGVAIQFPSTNILTFARVRRSSHSAFSTDMPVIHSFHMNRAGTREL